MSTSVIVDDRSTDLVYSPASAWIHSTGRAQEFQSTTSYAGTAGATMSFTFQGTSIQVYGSEGFGSGTTAAFAVDGGNATLASTTTNLNIRPATFHNAFFSSGPLLDGPHTLVMQVAPSGPLSNLFFDYITYTPSPNVPVAHDMFFVDDSNALLNYTGPTRPTDPAATGSYENFDKTATYMPNGTTATLTFSGTSIQVFGTVPKSALTGPAASFEIDAAVPTVVQYPPASYFLGNVGQNTDLNVASNYPWYDSGVFPAGTHTLTITSLLDSAFWLDYITVPTNGNTLAGAFPPAVAPVVSSTTSSAISSTSSTISSTSTKPKTTKAAKPTSSTAKASSTSAAAASGATSAGAIAGGVLGGLVALAVVGVLIIFLIKKRRQDREFGIPHKSLRPFSGGYTQPDPTWAVSRDELPVTMAPQYPHLNEQSYPPTSPMSPSGESTHTYNPYLDSLPSPHMNQQQQQPLQPAHPYAIPQHSFSRLQPNNNFTDHDRPLPSALPQDVSRLRQSSATNATNSPVYDLASLRTTRNSDMYGDADAYGGFV